MSIANLILIALIALAFGCTWNAPLRPFAFAAWVVAWIGIAVVYPAWFGSFAGYRGRDWLPTLIQIAMLGMGATLTLADFQRVFKMPRAVLLGMVLQFTVMPFGGFFIAKALQLPGELGAGLVLLGSCPGGVSSNVVTYLARGNVALSVTLTACSTLLSPLMTPLMTQWLAGSTVDVPVAKMMQDILWTVCAPVVLGLIINAVIGRLRWNPSVAHRGLAIVSMVAIILICAIIAAGSSDRLMQAGGLLLLAVALHNGLGYLLGYWGCRAMRCDEPTCRTISIEVGLQNGGLAAYLANEVLHSSAMALAAVLFAPWMNVSGSLLASWWRRSSTDPIETTNQEGNPKNLSI
jgi:bile acid:Na+ symporter, BASS family